MNRKSNPWVALVALILMALIVLCVLTGCADTTEAAEEDSPRFTVEEVEDLPGDFYGVRVIKDAETGVRYLVISYGQGVGVTKLEEGER